MEDLITFQGMYEFTRPKKECIPHKYFFSNAYIFSLQEGKEVLVATFLVHLKCFHSSTFLSCSNILTFAYFKIIYLLNSI